MCEAGGDAAAIWVCAPGDARCPLPRPHLGTPCTVDLGVLCSYGVFGLETDQGQECRDGVWSFVQGGGS
jgi:hypothetical protein